MLGARKRIIEVPIPTYYGDEICYVNGLLVCPRRGRRRAAPPGPPDGVRWVHPQGRRHRGLRGEAQPALLARSLLSWLTGVPSASVLDVGCSDGHFAGLVRSMGHHVVGVDLVKHEGIGQRIDSFVEADLNQGLPSEAGSGYDVIVAGDVLEHVIDPDSLMADMVSRLGDDGSILVSVPNFGHWYPRLRTVSGNFDYDQRGPLDRGHVRFFTRRSFERLIAGAGLRIVERRTVGSPLDVLERGGSPLVGSVARLRVRGRPRRQYGSGPRCSATSSSTSWSAFDFRPSVATRRGRHHRRSGPRWDPLLPRAARLPHGLPAHSSSPTVRLELLRPASERVPRRPADRAERFVGHRGLRHRRQDLHVLPAVPGPAADTRADAHARPRRPTHPAVDGARLAGARRRDDEAALVGQGLSAPRCSGQPHRGRRGHRPAGSRHRRDRPHLRRRAAVGLPRGLPVGDSAGRGVRLLAAACRAGPYPVGHPVARRVHPGHRSHPYPRRVGDERCGDGPGRLDGALRGTRRPTPRGAAQPARPAVRHARQAVRRPHRWPRPAGRLGHLQLGEVRPPLPLSPRVAGLDPGQRAPTRSPRGQRRHHHRAAVLRDVPGQLLPS